MIFHRWRLRTFLVWLLAVTSSITFLLTGATLLYFRLPQITGETRAELHADSEDMARRSEAMLEGLKTEIELLATVLESVPNAAIQPVFERAVAPGGFSALYQLDERGVVLRSAVSRGASRHQVSELLGNDLSRSTLFTRIKADRHTLWSNKYTSPLGNGLNIGIGAPAGRTVLIGELPLPQLLHMLQVGTRGAGRSVWVLDERGEVLADSENSSHVGATSLAGQPVFRQAVEQKHALDTLDFEGATYDAAISYSPSLNWYFLSRAPAGLSHPRVSAALELLLTAVGATVLLSLLLAPLWATRMARPISEINRRALTLAKGIPPEGAWPTSRLHELNELSRSLATMAAAIHEREEELAAIFEFSPVGLLLAAPEKQYAVVKANTAICQLLGYPLDELLAADRPVVALWKDPAQRQRLISQINQGLTAKIEGWLIRKDGSEFLGSIAARRIKMGDTWRVIWTAQDITEMRRIEQEVRQLNSELEARVQQRTELLRLTNYELTNTVERLQLTQQELVRSEKLASLGSLVAGVAHELNTPIGNGVMAVSTLRTALRQFREKSAEGLKRSMLDSLVDAVETGTDIAQRNLQRAAELVSGFKQVAVDQTSSQRRGFHLDTMVGEIAITLHPVLKKNLADLSLDIPPGLQMESYPGPLGQVLTNLIVNATVHAFGGREHGHIAIRAEKADDAHCLIRVEDDGVGIPPDLLPRIFDPFVTTRMGRGGTGLGLHIVHNITTRILGGSISVRSTPGEGSCFELLLPCVAPHLTVPAD